MGGESEGGPVCMGEGRERKRAGWSWGGIARVGANTVLRAELLDAAIAAGATICHGMN